MQVRLIVLLLSAAAWLGAQQLREIQVPFFGRQLVYVAGGQAAGSTPSPLLVFLPSDSGGDLASVRAFANHWLPAAVRRGWVLVVPWMQSTGPILTDVGVKALEAIVVDARNRFPVDSGRVYLAGAGDGATQAFYPVSRAPDLWTAALAIEGSPKPAIDTNRLFAANTRLVPMLWAVRPESQRVMAPLGQMLAAAQFNVAIRPEGGMSVDQAFDWLASHARGPFPLSVDCECGTTAFPRCYWIAVTRWDPALRNDVLLSTRVPAGSGAFLAIGSFGYDLSAPGPGVVVGWLPPGVKSPLQPGDRIVSLAGRPIRDGLDYMQMMDHIVEEKTVGLMIERGDRRIRLESRVMVPPRPEMLTARIQAEFMPAASGIQVLSRGAAEAQIVIPPEWVPVSINWNGVELGQVAEPGCRAISLAGALGPCGK